MLKTMYMYSLWQDYLCACLFRRVRVAPASSRALSGGPSRSASRSSPVGALSLANGAIRIVSL